MRTEPDVATCMYYTGLAPMTKKPVAVAKNLRDRKLQRALMQFFKPENYFEVREADHYHAVANPAKGEKPGERGAEPRKRKGYRPGRKEARRQDRNSKHADGDSSARP